MLYLRSMTLQTAYQYAPTAKRWMMHTKLSRKSSGYTSQEGGNNGSSGAISQGLLCGMELSNRVVPEQLLMLI